MARNVEIKARVKDLGAVRSIAEGLSDGPGVLLTQEDTFFCAPRGRLKLRVLDPQEAQLIFYERSNVAGPKTSHYLVAPVTDVAPLKDVLSAGLGVRGVVRKKRWLYRVGQTRIHLDEVEGLGTFLELEVMLRPDESEGDGRATAAILMACLGIRESDLVPGAYMDLLEM